MALSAPAIPAVTCPRPFLKWAGGKGKLLAQYEQYLPSDWQRYHEPFLGGGALFFGMQAKRQLGRSPWHRSPRAGPARPFQARLCDVNAELVNAYRCVRDHCPEVIDQLALHQQRHSETHYYQTRALPPLNAIERAARFIYLNKTCYNGLYRENAKGQFNVPMGRYKNPGICNPELLEAAALALADSDILEADFTQVLDQALGPEDFVYFDPPYYPLSPTSNFTGYSRYAFHQEEHRQLRDTCLALAERGVKVMLSNSDCAVVRELYDQPAFHIQEIAAARAINSKARRRGKITELLITSYPVAAEL